MLIRGQVNASKKEARDHIVYKLTNEPRNLDFVTCIVRILEGFKWEIARIKFLFLKYTPGYYEGELRNGMVCEEECDKGRVCSCLRQEPAVILTSWEAEIERIKSQVQPG